MKRTTITKLAKYMTQAIAAMDDETLDKERAFAGPANDGSPEAAEWQRLLEKEATQRALGDNKHA